MPIDVPIADRITRSQKELDDLKIVSAVLRGEPTQAEAARLLGLSTRQVGRLRRKLETHGDDARFHSLRGQPSNYQPEAAFKAAVPRASRQRYADFGPTFAARSWPK